MSFSVYTKGEKYINGCYLPDKMSRLDVRQKYGATDSGNVVAIDFGTTCCTLAYALDGHKEYEIRYLRIEEDNARIPTSIVIDDEGKVFAFGRDAQKRYLKLTEEQKQSHHFFHQAEIKMNLQHDEEVNWTYEIAAMNGKHFFLLEVIAMILKYLKEKFLKVEIMGGIRGQLEMEDFKWVLTVPAMWKARGKQLMREAAYKAGIGSKDGIIKSLTHVKKMNESTHLLSAVPSKLSSTSANPKLLSLALEPEAAAIYCLGQAKKTKAQIGDPQCYVVLDIGGGTLDITASKIDSEHTIDVILPPMGNDWGGMKVNRYFKDFLAWLVDDPHFQKYLGDEKKATKHRALLQELIDSTFEIQKQLFGSEDAESEDLEILVNLPYSFFRVYEDNLEKKIKNLKGITISDCDLSIRYSKLEELIQPVYTNIVAEIERCFHTLPKGTVVDILFLVGGFGACRLTHRKLEPEIKRIFFNSSPQLQIFRPDLHRLAIVNGAVEFVLNKDVVRSRIVDASYGAACSRNFEPAIHDRKQKFYNDDRQEKCNNLFTPFVLRGDKVEAGQVLVKTFNPINHNQIRMNFELYSSQSRNVEYTRDPQNQAIDGVNSVGLMNIDMPEKEGDKNREVKLVFDFTHSEIQVEAYDIASGNRVSTVLDFLTDNYYEKTKSSSDIF